MRARIPCILFFECILLFLSLLQTLQTEQVFANSGEDFKPPHASLMDDANEKAASAHRTNPNEKNGYSVIPVVAVNSTYGFLFGGAVIYYKPLEYYHQLSLLSVFTFSKQGLAQILYEAKGKEWVFGIKQKSSNFYEPYHSNGKDFAHDTMEKVYATAHSFEPYIARRYSAKHQSQVSWIHKTRFENDKSTPGQGIDASSQHVFPNETTNAWGISFSYESLREPFLSPIGSFFQAKVVNMPGGNASSLRMRAFTQLNFDFRFFKDINDYFTLAQRLYTGNSWGEPSHSFKYSFGGPELLRGYGFSRFLGNNFIIGQIEGRYPIWRKISGSSFVELGNITESKHYNYPLLWSVGTGVKVGVPPDYVAKLRFEVGFGERSINFSMQANHAF